MSNATERIVNLVLFLAEAGAPVTAERVRTEVEGYDEGQDAAAFIRMFERDKDELRAMGFGIEADAEGHYWLDAAATFAEDIELADEEATAIRVVGLALLDDPTFPFRDELRFALAKLATQVETPDAPVVARMADERPEDQGAVVAALDRASTHRKRVEFDYVNSRGDHKHHRLEAYGLFAREGRWYAVGRDIDTAEIRVYAVSRMSDLVVDAARPKTPDYERPADFDVATFIRLPFQYGPDDLDVALRLDPTTAWMAPGLFAGAGRLDPIDDGSLQWHGHARDRDALMRWVIENGPGISITGPPDLAEELARGLARVASMHAEAAS